MTDETFKLAVTAIASFGGAGGLGAAWWFKKWINGVDKSIKELTKSVNTLVVSDAVQQEKKSQFDGSLSQIQKCLNETTKDVGILSASIKKVWEVIEKVPSFGIKDRISDRGDS